MKSIYKILTDEEKRNEVGRNAKDMAGSGIGLLSAGYIGRKMLQGGNADIGKSIFRNVKENLRPGSTSNNTSAGQTIGRDIKRRVDESFYQRTQKDLESSKAFFEGLTEEGKRVLEKTVEGVMQGGTKKSREQIIETINQEKIALLTALRDSISEIGGLSDQNVRNEVLQKIDNIMNNDLNRTSELSGDLEEVVRTLRDNVPEDIRIKEMHRFRAMKENSRFFTGTEKAKNVADSFTKERRTAATFEEAFDLAYSFARGKGMNTNERMYTAGEPLSEFGEKQKTRLKKQKEIFEENLKKYGGKIGSFEVVPEHNGRMASIYMSPVGSQNSNLGKVALYTSNIQGQRAVARATEELATPMNVPRVILPIHIADQLLKNKMKPEEASRMLMGFNFAKFDQDTFLQMVEASGGSLDDLTRRDEISLRYKALRGFGENAFGALYGNQGQKRNISQRMAENLQMNQTLMSNRIIIYDPTGKKSNKELKSLPIQLERMYPELFQAPANSDVAFREAQIPGSGRLVGINVQMVGTYDASGKRVETITPFSALRKIGYSDRVTQPLTARESQLVGRQELISNVFGVNENLEADRSYTGSLRNQDNFGVNKNIPLLATGNDLLSVSNVAGDPGKGLGKMHGVNLAGLMLLHEPLERVIGLEEGAAYYGGRFETRIAINKTVYDPESMNRPEFKFLRKLINQAVAYEKGEKGRGEKRTIKLKKQSEIESFFRAYANSSGEIPIGEIDDRIASIKKFTNMSYLEIGIEDVVMKNNEVKQYRLTGETAAVSDRLKLFSILGRITGKEGPIDINQMESLIGRALDSDELKSVNTDAKLSAREFIGKARSEFGVVSKGTVITGDGMIKRSSDFSLNFMYGGYRMAGGTESSLSEEIKNIGADTAEGIMKFAKTKLSIDNILTNDFNRASNIMKMTAMIRALKKDVPGLSAESYGLIFNTLKVREKDAGKASNEFGLITGDIERIFKEENFTPEQMRGVQKAFSSMLSIGAATATAGMPDYIFGRNSAKFEPRHMNYLHYGLKTFFGLNSEQTSKYLVDFALRQEGIEYSGKFLPDVLNVAMSPTKDPRGLIEEFSKARRITPDEFMTLGQASTEVGGPGIDPEDFRRKLIDIADETSPTVFDVRMLKDTMSEEQYNRVKRILPSETLILPSAESVRGMKGYQVRTGESMQNIDATLIENMKRIFGGLFNISLGSDESFSDNYIRRIKSGVEGNLEAAGMALRRGLSGSISGSLTSQGSGIIMADEFMSETMNPENFDHIKRVFEQEKGYVFFSDTKGFMDSLDKFMGATRSHGMSDIEGKALLADRMRTFLYQGVTPAGEKVKTHTELLIRNPEISPNNSLPGMAVGRYDIAEEIKIMPLLNKGNRAFLRDALLNPESIRAGLSSSDMKERELFKSFVNRGILSSVETVEKPLEELDFNERRMFERGDLPEGGFTKKQVVDHEETFKRLMRGEDVNLRVDITERDLFKIEEYLSSEDAQFGTLGGRKRFEQQISAFNAAQQEFYGMNKYSVSMGSSNEQIESIIERIDSDNLPEKSRMTKKLRGMQNILTEREGYTQRKFNEIFAKDIAENFHIKHGVGGGNIAIPTYDATITLSSGKEFTSRIDLAFGLIGDWDADIYQRYHELSGVMQEVRASENFDAVRDSVMRKNLRFGVMRNIVNESLNALAKDMGSSAMEVSEFIADQAKKEQILKLNVGPLDVEVKSLATSAMSMDMGKVASSSMDDLLNGKLLFEGLDLINNLALMQEMGIIKAKKLPKALPLTESLKTAIQHGLKTGDSRSFVTEMESIFLNRSELIQEIQVTDVKIKGLDGQVADQLVEQLKTIKMDSSFIEYGARVIEHGHKMGFANLASESRLSKAMAQNRSTASQIFNQGFQERRLLEFGMAGELDLNKVEHRHEAIDKLADFMERLTSGVNRRSAIARTNLSGGAISALGAGGLALSYALSSSYSREALSGPDMFSDERVRESIGNRQLYNSFGRESSAPSANSMQHPSNMYERPITDRNTIVNKQQSFTMSGQVGNVSSARQVLNSVVAAGGRGHLSIQDNVLPRPNIADYYLKD